MKTLNFNFFPKQFILPVALFFAGECFAQNAETAKKVDLSGQKDISILTPVRELNPGNTNLTDLGSNPESTEKIYVDANGVEMDPNSINAPAGYSAKKKEHSASGKNVKNNKTHPRSK